MVLTNILSVFFTKLFTVGERCWQLDLWVEMNAYKDQSTEILAKVASSLVADVGLMFFELLHRIASVSVFEFASKAAIKLCSSYSPSNPCSSDNPSIWSDSCVIFVLLQGVSLCSSSGLLSLTLSPSILQSSSVCSVFSSVFSRSYFAFSFSFLHNG